MADAAQGEPKKHEVFEKPFKVQPVFEMRSTPESYRHYPDGDKLPSQIKVWKVQDTGQQFGSVVTHSYGYEDSPDAEILTPGFNDGKESGAVGVGRHASFLQWGFSGPPSKLTPAGKNFFINSICYIHKFDNVAPLVRQQAMARTYLVHLASILPILNDPNEFFEGIFAKDLKKIYQSDPKGFGKYINENLEFIYFINIYQPDMELKSLGIPSNRQGQTLERLISLLEDEKQKELAQKLLLRYTTESFQTQAQWKGWLESNKSRLYFSDMGGYKFRVIPEGYVK